MKYFELTKEEKKLLKELEADKWVSVKNFEDVKKKLVSSAKNTFNKTRNINIRLSERVVSRLKAKAAQEGIPYQTLASSVLHKYVSR